MGLLYGENFVIFTFNRFCMIHLCDRRTDRRAIAYSIDVLVAQWLGLLAFGVRRRTSDDSRSARYQAPKWGQLSLPSIRGRLVEYQPSPAKVKARLRRAASKIVWHHTSVTPRSSEMACPLRTYPVFLTLTCSVLSILYAMLSRAKKLCRTWSIINPRMLGFRISEKNN